MTKKKRNAVKDYQRMQVVSDQTGCLYTPRKLKDIKEQLRTLHEKSVLLRVADNAQDSEDVSGLLEDLQEVVNDYMVRS